MSMRGAPPLPGTVKPASFRAAPKAPIAVPELQEVESVPDEEVRGYFSPHVGVMALCAVQLAFLVSVLADGRSVLLLKGDPPVVIDGKYSLRTVLGWPYGIGLDHDQGGKLWTSHGGSMNLNDLYLYIVSTPTYASAGSAAQKMQVLVNGIVTAIQTNPVVARHPAAFLDCEAIVEIGQMIKCLGYITCGLIFAALMISAACMGLNMNLQNPAYAIQFIELICWIIIVAGASSLFQVDYSCNNPIIEHITLKDHFDFNYGISFAATGLIASLVNLALIHCHEHREPEPDKFVPEYTEEEIKERIRAQGEDPDEKHQSGLVSMHESVEKSVRREDSAVRREDSGAMDVAGTLSNSTMNLYSKVDKSGSTAALTHKSASTAQLPDIPRQPVGAAEAAPGKVSRQVSQVSNVSKVSQPRYMDWYKDEQQRRGSQSPPEGGSQGSPRKGGSPKKAPFSN